MSKSKRLDIESNVLTIKLNHVQCSHKVTHVHAKCVRQVGPLGT